jgi:hypothetical protein
MVVGYKLLSRLIIIEQLGQLGVDAAWSNELDTSRPTECLPIRADADLP